MYIYIYIYIYMCVCVCVCVTDKEWAERFVVTMRNFLFCGFVWKKTTVRRGGSAVE